MNETGGWKEILMHDLPYSFLLEVMLRTVIMFVVILLALRASGRRGIKQLSIFELVLIIGLGSAAGDPMFYEDVGILPAFTVFLVVITLYITVTRLADRFKELAKLLEGEPLYMIRDGRILMDAFAESGLSQDEFFAELRLRNVEHLGQVKTVLIETSGEFSILFYDEGDVRFGLPIFPDELNSKAAVGDTQGPLSCVKCGYTTGPDDPGASAHCPGCDDTGWIAAKNSKRIA